VAAAWWWYRQPGEVHPVAHARLTGRGTGYVPAGTGPPRWRAWIAVAAITGAVTSAAAGYAASAPDGQLHVTVLSTGEAPSVLVRGDDGALALIDGGRSPSLLLEALGRVLGPTDHRIDLVVVTGGEEAAVAGLAGLPGHYAVGTVVASRDLNPSGENPVAAPQTAGAAAVDSGWRA